MENNKTDRVILFKGLNIMIFAVLSLFMGPILLSIGFDNPEKPLHIPLIIVGCLICALAIFFIFKGINFIMSSMFKKK